MNSTDFVETIKELHKNRGVHLTEICRELKISLRWLYCLKSQQYRINQRILNRAEVVFPELLDKYHPLVNSYSFVRYDTNLEEKNGEAARKNQERRDRILGVIEGRKDRKTESPFSINLINSSKT
jgi:hypothetical protein